MGWLFRKSIKIFPGFRVNLGKKGITSATIGRGGWFSTNISGKGVRHNISVPGTGLTYQTPRVGEIQNSPDKPTYNYEWLEDGQLSVTWACHNCQSLNPPQNNFCGICGYGHMSQSRIQVPPVARIAPPNNSNRNALLIIGGIFVGLMAVCVICGGLAGRQNPSTPTVPAALVTRSPTPLPSPTPSATPAKRKLASVPQPIRSPKPVTTPPSEDMVYDAVPRRSFRSGRLHSKGSGYITGPRGGCYYINSNGNKTYVDHSFCR